MATKMDQLVDVAKAAAAEHDPEGRMPRAVAKAMVEAVLKALSAPDTAMLAAGSRHAAPAARFSAMVAAVSEEDARAVEVRPVVQGVGFEYLRDGAVVGRILECMDGKSWSVRVEGKRWRLPPNAPSPLIHPDGVADVTYQPSRAAAEGLLLAALPDRRRILEWPEAA